MAGETGVLKGIAMDGFMKSVARWAARTVAGWLAGEFEKEVVMRAEMAADNQMRPVRMDVHSLAIRVNALEERLDNQPSENTLATLVAGLLGHCTPEKAVDEAIKTAAELTKKCGRE